ncbi:MAG: GNAT family N-acetyltransferase [Herpetosiphonaceae bacterium]|nr:GNAT family N-acetyltransferase [Herpetosiphonaceae bacterium]
MSVSVRPITVAETRPLRSQVLRPGQPPENLVYPGDDTLESWHVGAFVDSALVGIASIYREVHPDLSAPQAWRLRGMAVDPGMQRRGLGRALVLACIAHVKAQSGRQLWCNGRTSAADFYRSLGFELVGEEFPTESGPHYVMRLAL